MGGSAPASDKGNARALQLQSNDQDFEILSIYGLMPFALLGEELKPSEFVKYCDAESEFWNLSEISSVSFDGAKLLGGNPLLVSVCQRTKLLFMSSMTGETAMANAGDGYSSVVPAKKLAASKGQSVWAPVIACDFSLVRFLFSFFFLQKVKESEKKAKQAGKNKTKAKKKKKIKQKINKQQSKLDQ